MARVDTLALYITNMATNKSLILDAHIDSLSETLTAEWNDEDFFGRSEEIGIYVKGSRDFVTTLKVYVPSKDSIKHYKWARDFFQSLTRPTYGASGSFNKAPLARVRLGGSWDHYIKFLTININYDPLVWDNNKGHSQAYPMFMTVDMNGRIVHDEVPSANYDKWYRDSEAEETYPSIDEPIHYDFVDIGEAEGTEQIIYSSDSITLSAMSTTDLFAGETGYTFEWWDIFMGYLPF